MLLEYCRLHCVASSSDGLYRHRYEQHAAQAIIVFDGPATSAYAAAALWLAMSFATDGLLYTNVVTTLSGVRLSTNFQQGKDSQQTHQAYYARRTGAY